MYVKINKEVLGISYNRSRRSFTHFCIFFSTLNIKFTCTKYMLEVVPGSSNTGTDIRIEACNFGNLKSFFPCIMLYGFCVERENVDIDLVLLFLFFYVRKELYHL